MTSKFSQFLKGPGSCREVLKIALPLILSTGAVTVQFFIDRVFLMWYSSESMAAAMFSGMTAFTVLSLFLGTAMYVNTFVAQYDGAAKPERIGASVWQGIYFSLVAGLIIAALAPFADDICRLAGHTAKLQDLETTYLRINLLGGMPTILSACLSCFYTGRAKTWTVLWVNSGVTAVNLVLDYLWIFGKGGFPEWGITGAACAHVTANLFGSGAFLILFLRKEYRSKTGIISGMRFDRELFVRMMRFGLPSGVHFMLDVVGWALFLAFVGRISTESLTASSMAFQINTLAFMPMLGFSTAVSTIVGRHIGAGNTDLAARSTWSAISMTATYMGIVAIGYWAVPDIFMLPFKAGADAEVFANVAPITVTLLLFVGFYCLFDSGNLVFSAAVKGAGDTRFVMLVSVILSWVILVIPSYLLIKYLHGLRALYFAWGAATAYVCVLAIVFLLRFMAGKWKHMRVIEAPPPVSPAAAPVPTIEVDEPI